MKYSHKTCKSLLSNHGGHGIVYTEIDAFCQINLVCDLSQGRLFALNDAIAMIWESITGESSNRTILSRNSPNLQRVNPTDTSRWSNPGRPDGKQSITTPYLPSYTMNNRYMVTSVCCIGAISCF